MQHPDTVQRCGQGYLALAEICRWVGSGVEGNLLGRSMIDKLEYKDPYNFVVPAVILTGCWAARGWSHARDGRQICDHALRRHRTEPKRAPAAINHPMPPCRGRLPIAIDALRHCLCPVLDSAYSTCAVKPLRLAGLERKKPSKERHISNLRPVRIHDCTKVRNQNTEVLYEQMSYAADSGLSNAVQQVAEILVLERHEKPNHRLYAALILSNIDAKEGSAGRAASLLQECKDEGITPNSDMYHSMLKVCHGLLDTLKYFP